MINAITNPRHNVYNQRRASNCAVGESKPQNSEIVSTVAYLIGVPKSVFEGEYSSLKIEVYDKLNSDKSARIIRHLCCARTSVMHFFKYIDNCIKNPAENRLFMHCLPQDSLIQLSNDGISLNFHSKATSTQCIIEMNQLISDRTNNCMKLFPSWLNWQYIRELFIMPNGFAQNDVKKAVGSYCLNRIRYPYQMYINWQPADEGNILYSDKKFLHLLYRWNDDEFAEYHKLSDSKSRVLKIIAAQLYLAKKTVVMVDCENSDMYKLSTLLSSLDESCRSRIAKIILVDDPSTLNSWSRFDEFTDIPVERMVIDRIKRSKSLVDNGLIARTCAEYYENSVDSFMVVSSDSDFWTLPCSLPKAKFLFAVEYENFSSTFRNALKNNGIHYCYIDGFKPENADKLAETELVERLNYELNKHPVNINEIEHSFSTSKNSSDTNISYIIDNLRVSIDTDGYLRFRLIA